MWETNIKSRTKRVVGETLGGPKSTSEVESQSLLLKLKGKLVRGFDVKVRDPYKNDLRSMSDNSIYETITLVDRTKRTLTPQRPYGLLKDTILTLSEPV